MKKDIETHLEKQTHELVKKMQELKVDPLQLGIQTKRPFSKPMEEKNGLKCLRRWTLK
nr:Ger(x)C family spore germination C-terminal domain-containing protein [Priestia flexa]WEZ08875.1 Ger(x)C family spore germination C-terminal domain-containing protein [Priestia flexa]